MLKRVEFHSRITKKKTRVQHHANSSDPHIAKKEVSTKYSTILVTYSNPTNVLVLVFQHSPSKLVGAGKTLLRAGFDATRSSCSRSMLRTCMQRCGSAVKHQRQRTSETIRVKRTLQWFQRFDWWFGIYT